MSDRYELTPDERDAWRARVAPHVGAQKFFLLADRGGFADQKNAASYIGEFADGKPRALRYFFGEPRRLDKLCRALEVSPATLEGYLREVQAGHARRAGMLWLPGFEDWGPVAFDEGFVPPPLGFPNGDTADTLPYERILAKLDGGVSVVGAEGSGVTTVLRRIAAWAAADGWQVTWGLAGGLPRGRAALLVLDGHEVADPAALKAWTKESSHGLLRGSATTTGRRLPFERPIGGYTLYLRPVDAAWLASFLDAAARLAPKGESRRLRALALDPVAAALQALHAPSPEIAGCLVREALEGRVLDVAAQGVRYVLDVAVRRLAGLRRREHAAVLRRGEDWLADAWVGWVADTLAPVTEPLERELLERARAALAEIRATEEERELLRAMLPFASGSSLVESLVDAQIVREEDDGTSRFRLEGLLAPALAHRLVASPDTLRASLLARRHGVLVAVSRAPGGPAALARALRDMEPPALAVAAGALSPAADWLVRVAWDAALVARVLAVWLTVGEVPSNLLRLTSAQSVAGKLPPLWTVLGSARSLPAAAAIQAELETVAAALGAPRPAWDDATLTMILALAAPTAATLTTTTVWDALPEAIFPPRGWVEHLARTTDGLLFLVDPARSSVAMRVLRIKTDTTLLREPESVHAWAALVASLFAQAPEAAVDLLARMVRACVEETLAHAAASYEAALSRRQARQRRVFETWEGDFGLRLDGVAAAVQLPEARRHARSLKSAVRDALRGWEPFVDDPTLPVEAWLRGGLTGDRTVRHALSVLLRLAFAADDRVRFLRTADGHLSPFWEPAVRAGVPFDAALALYRDVESEVLPARPGLGGPIGSDLDFARRMELQPPSAAVDVLACLVEICSPEEIGRIPGFTPVGSGPLPNVSSFNGFFERPSLRAYLWTFADSLSEDDVLWRLLDRRIYDQRFEDVGLDLFGKGRFADAFSDRPGLCRMLAKAPGAPLAAERWDRLATAALLAAVPDEDLAPLLDSPAVGGARPTLLLRVLQRSVAADEKHVGAWLLARLEDQPSVVDRALFAPVWHAARVDPDRLEAWLSAHRDESRGDGLVRALVLSGRERFAEWLADPGTRDAALGALAASPDWPSRLGPALADRAAVPSDAVLAWLVGEKSGIGFDVLDRAAAGWPAERRRALWEAVARVSGERWTRTEAWRRMVGG